MRWCVLVALGFISLLLLLLSHKTIFYKREQKREKNTFVLRSLFGCSLFGFKTVFILLLDKQNTKWNSCKAIFSMKWIQSSQMSFTLGNRIKGFHIRRLFYSDNTFNWLFCISIYWIEPAFLFVDLISLKVFGKHIIFEIKWLVFNLVCITTATTKSGKSFE